MGLGAPLGLDMRVHVGFPIGFPDELPCKVYDVPHIVVLPPAFTLHCE